MSIVVGIQANTSWHRLIRQQQIDRSRWFDWALEKTAALGREYGFSPMGFEFTDTDLPSTDPVYLDELAARLRAEKLEPSVYMGRVRPVYDAATRAESIDICSRSLDALARIGVRTVSVYTGGAGRITRDARFRLTVEVLTALGRVARGLGIRIGQENYDYFTSAELLRISEQTGLDNVGVLSDTGNWLILREDPVAATRACLARTFHAHVRDYALENGVYNGVALGEGLVDFPAVLPELVKAGAREPIMFSLELDTDDRDEDEATHQSCVYLKSWLAGQGAATAAR